MERFIPIGTESGFQIKLDTDRGEFALYKNNELINYYPSLSTARLAIKRKVVSLKKQQSVDPLPFMTEDGKVGVITSVIVDGATYGGDVWVKWENGRREKCHSDHRLLKDSDTNFSLLKAIKELDKKHYDLVSKLEKLTKEDVKKYFGIEEDKDG